MLETVGKDCQRHSNLACKDNYIWCLTIWFLRISVTSGKQMFGLDGGAVV